MLDQIIKLIKVLNSETAPEQISLALAFAMIVGLTPLWSLHNLLVLLLVMLLRVNVSTFLAGMLLFSMLAYLLDPLFHELGYLVLTLEPLHGLFTVMNNSSLWRIENFNNTILMGSLLFSLICFVPVYLVGIKLIQRYRTQFIAWVKKSRLAQVLKAKKWVSLFIPDQA